MNSQLIYIYVYIYTFAKSRCKSINYAYSTVYQCKTWIRHRGSVSAKASCAVTLHWRSAVMRGHVHHCAGRCTNFCSDSSPSRPDCDAAGRLETFPFSPLLSLRLPLLPLCIKQLAATSPRILGKKFFRKNRMCENSSENSVPPRPKVVFVPSNMDFQCEN